jgi:hypothetical protein
MLTDEQISRYNADIVSFAEEQFYLDTGALIVLEPWQKDLILRPIFDTREASGLRRYNLALAMIPKKNGKSTLASIVSVYELLHGDVNPEVYSIAGDKDQARIIFDKTKTAVSRNPDWRKAVNIYRDAIELKNGSGVYRVLSADAPTAHGLNPSCVIGDEMWNQPNEDLWTALTYSPVRREPLYFLISYAGFDRGSLLYRLSEQGRLKANPRMYYFHSEVNLASWVTPEYLENQKKVLHPAEYQRMHECRWSSKENAFLTEEDVGKCTNYSLRPRLLGVRDGWHAYFISCDLGLVRDRTAVTVLHKDSSSGKVVLDNLRVWQGTSGDPVLIADVEEFIVSCLRNFDVESVIIDPYQMKGTVQRMRGSGVPVEEFTFSTANIQKLSSNLYYLFHGGFIEIYDDRELVQELLEVSAKQTSYGWRIDHEGGRHDDRVISLGMCALRAIEHEPVDLDTVLLN